MACRNTKADLHGVPLYITEDHLGFCFSKFEEVADVPTVKGKTGIVTGDIEILNTINRRNFREIPAKFQQQLIRLVKWELVRAVIENKIRSFTTKYIQGLALDRAKK